MIQKPIKDKELARHLDMLSPDGMHVFVLGKGHLRGVLVNGTRLVNNMRANHEYGVLESFIASHAYLGGAILSANVKGVDRISFQINCNGPVEGISVEAVADGSVRGYLKNTPIPVDVPPESLDMSPYIGEGTISMTRILQRAKQPFTGTVNLAYGNIAQDLAQYFTTSEQVPTAFNLSVQFDERGQLTGAGGLMVQAFPGAEDEFLELADRTVRNLPSIGRYFSQGNTADEFLETHMSALSPDVIGEKDISFSCHCNKERFGRFLSALPVGDIKDIRDNGPFPVRTTCHNCNTTYEFSQEEIENAYQMAR